MITLYKEDDIHLLKDRVIFFDANILFSVYFTINPTDWAQRNYSRVLSKLMKTKNELTFDVTVASEVINRALRMEYKTYLRKNNVDENSLSYKVFRNREEGKSAWLKTCEMMRDVIFRRFTITGKCWEMEDLDSILNLEGDFNDLLIANLCIERNYVLLTNDVDFKNTDLEILSLNSKFFEYI